MDNSWVKLYRKIIDESWYTKPTICHLAQHLIMKANTKDQKIIFNKQELLVKRGQLITGRNKLSEETGLTCRQIRTGLQVLINSQFSTSKTTNRFTIITICNYDKYQSNENKNCQQNDQQKTNKRPQYKNIYIIYNTTTNKFTNIHKKDISNWQKAYPDINIENELLQIAEWCKANPKKIQNRKDLRKTITNWFAREQDKKEAQKPKSNKKPVDWDRYDKDFSYKRGLDENKWKYNLIRP